MANMIDYLHWRGDIRFSQLPPNSVDSLIFSTLSYIRFEGIVPSDLHHWITLKDACDRFLAQPGAEAKVRVRQDLTLLREAAASQRYRDTALCCYQSVLIPEEETQFSAITFYLSDGSAFLAFRGTDSTLTGWKEDFNMSFQSSVPAQRKALQYLRNIAESTAAPLRLGGHSKGGNLAVYAAAMADPTIQQRVKAVYNQDGPGFSAPMMVDPGYQAIVPKIRTYVPQSSVIGMLLEHEEPYIIVKSSTVGLLQHDPYSWEVLGKDFIPMEEISESSRFLNQTIKNWLAVVDSAQRNAFVDAVFDLLSASGAEFTDQLLQPKRILGFLKTIHGDDNLRNMLLGEVLNFVNAARQTQLQIGE